MQRESPRQRLAAGGPAFEGRLEKEEEILDGLVMRLGRGSIPGEVWARLHEAAQRDGRLAELAFAYESVAQSRRLRTFPPAVGAEFNFQAATYFGDVFGDELGAVTYLERALALVPVHVGAFERLAELLAKTQNWKRLGELYAEAAPHRPRAEQGELLRAAAELFDRAGGLEDKAIDVYQQLLKIDPQDHRARGALEARYLRANRVRDVARLYEQALATEVPPGEDDERRLRARLIDLYATQLHEPERSIAHIEALLAMDPAHGEAQRVAGKLLVIKGLAARAASALAAAQERLGDHGEVARLLAVELEHTRGPKRRDVLRRLGILKQDRLSDLPGAYETFEAALGLDPTDDDLRHRYEATAKALGRQLDAARTLSRVGMMVKDGALRARLSSAMGGLLLDGGDARKARATFATVLASPDAGDDALLDASRALATIYTAEKDYKSLGEALERIVRLEPDGEALRAEGERLAELYSGVLRDPQKAIVAWRRLVSTSSRPRALLSLQVLYEETGNAVELAGVLEERSKDARSPLEGRELLVRAADVLTVAGEGARASSAWRRVVEKFGAARDIHEKWIPLLEAQRQWFDLAEALAAEAQLAPEGERPAIYARLGSVHLARLRDAPAALEAYRRALALDPNDKSVRGAVEKLLSVGDHRLAAAAVLEPLYRRAGASDVSSAQLLRLLDVRASLSKTATERLAALEEARLLCEASPNDRPRAIEFAGRGLAEAVRARAPITPWLHAVERAAGAGKDTADLRIAPLLYKALGDRDVDSPSMFALAQRAGETLAATGDVPAALDAFRKALAFDPSSQDIVARASALLKEQGNPEERVALYHAAASRETDRGRKLALYHSIAVLLRRDIGDKQGAMATYRKALELDEDDGNAHAGLVELLTETEAWGELGDELERHLGRTRGEDAWATRLRIAEVAAEHGERGRAQAHGRALLGEEFLPRSYLDGVARIAELLVDVDLTCDVLRRRARDSEAASEEVAWLEALGVVQLEQRHDPASAAATWRVAARSAGASGDFALARRLYERVRTVAPRDHEAAQHLAEILERAEQWHALPELYAVLLEHAPDTDGQVDVLLRAARLQESKLHDIDKGAEAAARAFAIAPLHGAALETFERLAIAAHRGALFADAVASAIAAHGGDASLRIRLELAKARVLSTEAPGGNDDLLPAAAETYQRLLADGEADDTSKREASSAFEALLAGAPETAFWNEHRRGLLAWRASHFSEHERVTALAAWAAAEENVFGDLGRALELSRRLLEWDPDSGQAMAAIARLSLATGDVDGAIDALALRREKSEGAARNALDLEIATLLLRLPRHDGEGAGLSQAIACVASVLESAPQDAAALDLAAKLLERDDGYGRAVELLERVLEVSEDGDVRVLVLSFLLATPSRRGEDARRCDWYERLIDLHLAHPGEGRKGVALGVALRAVAEWPAVERLWDRVEQLAREQARPQEVAQLYHDALGGPLSPEVALALGERAVAFFEEWFEDSEGVAQILQRVLEIDPTGSWAFDRLKLLYNAAERWDALFALYDRALSTVALPRASRLEILEDAAQVAKDFAGDPERAIFYLEQLHNHKPNDLRLSASLERLYERRGRHRELIALLAAQIAASPTSTSAQKSRLRVARLWLDDLSDASSALLTVEEMITYGVKRDGEGEWDDDICMLLEKILEGAPPMAEVRDVLAVPTVTEGPANGGDKTRRESQPPASLSGKRPLVRQRGGEPFARPLRRCGPRDGSGPGPRDRARGRQERQRAHPPPRPGGADLPAPRRRRGGFFPSRRPRPFGARRRCPSPRPRRRGGEDAKGRALRRGARRGGGRLHRRWAAHRTAHAGPPPSKGTPSAIANGPSSCFCACWPFPPSRAP